jgi:ABC-type Mn2+/Zn2+ transport system permease subunit
MHEWLDMFRQEFVQRALVGALLGGFLSGYLGGWVVLRKMALTVDAISHSLFAGLAVAATTVGFSAPGMLLGGLCSGLFVAGGAEVVRRTTRIKRDTAIGILYTVSYGFGLMVLARHSFRLSIEHWLFGDIFSLAGTDLVQLLGWTQCVFPILVALERPLALCCVGEEVARSIGIRTRCLKFLLMAALLGTAVLNFKVAGVVATVSLLVAPAATLYLLTDKFALLLWGSAALGAGGAVLGVAIASVLESVSGGVCIALVQGCFFLCALVFSPRYGVLALLRKEDHYCEESFWRWHQPPGAALRKNRRLEGIGAEPQ